MTTQIETGLRAALAEEGVTLGVLILLQILMSRGGPTTPGELAQSMMLTKGAISQSMDKLESERLITRTRMALDRRVILIEPTQKARSWFEKLHFVAVDELTHTFQGWNNHEIKKLLDLLNRLRTRNPEIRASPRKTNGFSE